MYFKLIMRLEPKRDQTTLLQYAIVIVLVSFFIYKMRKRGGILWKWNVYRGTETIRD